METTEIIRILRQCGECCLTNCTECPEYKKAEEGFRKDPEAVGFVWSCGDILLDAADRLESLDKRWKRTAVERDQARQMRERAERLLGQAREEAMDLRKDIEAQGEIILELNRDLKRCREALNGQGEYEYLGGDLISREALIERMDNVDWYSTNDVGVLHTGAANPESAYVRWKDVYAAVEAALAVEAESVVHAYWIRVGWGYYKCSHCEAEIGSFSGHKNYCANCGAHMDEEVADV